MSKLSMKPTQGTSETHPTPRDIFREIASDFLKGTLSAASSATSPPSGIAHKLSLPHFPQYNEIVESAVRSIKVLLLKTGNIEFETFKEGLLELRNTPLRYGSLSIVFGRPMQSRLPAHNLSLAEDWHERLNEHDRHIAKQHEYARNHFDTTANQLNPILTGSKVWIQDPTSKI
ncbi:unnamed protein product [Lepeophtheirus salmonis]|uniref:(salmon louse) hypothetical protein n=1 Tax=Lepeophtheirus salmonis TaxID=72036 RepID=A0A7R8CYR7_LEPSM|nr:unnamed protein product [Lepeophtheirus salmonis]CAF2971148.1 unnamed protein product [Lepeophtheirus salmonis]